MTRGTSTVGFALFTLAALGPSVARAQSGAPEACAQEARSADYGPITIGTAVVPQRHRYVGADSNWDTPMGRFLGREARVTRLSGVDERGCPGVRLDVDGGRFFWRVRDLSIGLTRPRRVESSVRADRIPEACGRSGAAVSYGPLRVGSRVVLGRHRPVAGVDNWSEDMAGYLGHTARVVELAGADNSGCPGVHVDTDSGEWFWRVRDLRIAEDGGADFPPGVAAEHGRVAGPDRPLEEQADARVPQACGLTDQTAIYAPVAIGTEIVLGRHRPVDGHANWVDEMDPFVGRLARVTELVGVDDQGCPLIRVDRDEGEWYWRLRDVQLP